MFGEEFVHFAGVGGSGGGKFLGDGGEAGFGGGDAFFERFELAGLFE